MGGVTPFIPEPLVLVRGAVCTYEFAETLVSRCSATHFRLLVQTKAGKGKDTRHCAGHPSPLRLSVAARTGCNTGGLARSRALLQLRTESSPVAAFCRMTPLANPPYKNRDLERAPARLPVFIPLGVAPSSGGGKRKKTAGCLSAASFRPSRLPPEPRRESMRSIGARQGALLLVTSLGQAREVTRTAVRNPKPEFARVVDSDAPIEQRVFPYPSVHQTRSVIPPRLVDNTRHQSQTPKHANVSRGLI